MRRSLLRLHHGLLLHQCQRLLQRLSVRLLRWHLMNERLLTLYALLMQKNFYGMLKPHTSMLLLRELLWRVSRLLTDST